MMESFPLETVVAVITGTHSAGKSTLLAGFEQGKLSDLVVRDRIYDDLGYGIVDSPNGQRALITVPETARWLADRVKRPDFLAENYSLDFQLDIDALVKSRIHAAIGSTGEVVNALLEQGKLSPSKATMKPVVLSDRGPLDGVIYSQERMPDQDTNMMNGLSRLGHNATWMRGAVDLVIVADATDIPFERDEARLDDVVMRQRIAQSVLSQYGALVSAEDLAVVSGSREERHAQVASLLATLSLHDKLNWPNVPAIFPAEKH
jgi:hypothetical protein